MTLSVPAAAGSLSATDGGGGAVVAGSVSASLTVTGQLAAVNLALDTLVFTGAADFDGTAILEIVADDKGNTGSDGARLTRAWSRLRSRPTTRRLPTRRSWRTSAIAVCTDGPQEADGSSSPRLTSNAS